MREQSGTAKKLTGRVILTALLAICLCITTFALVYSTAAADSNLFQTGEIKINLNDEKPVIEESGLLFEPGMTVEKNFFIENQSTWDVYYKLYLDNMEGGLADVLDVELRNGGTVLFSGKAADMTRERVGAATDILKPQERRDLTISFHFPKNAGNTAQRRYLSFSLNADAVQTKNNPQGLFE